MANQLDPQARAELLDAVTLLLGNWFVLRTAVEQGWGGHESEAKAKWLLDTIGDYLASNGHKIDVDEIAFVIQDVMNEEFQTVLLDNSCYEIAQTLYRIYRDCALGNYEQVEILRNQFPNALLPINCNINDSSSDEQDTTIKEFQDESDATMKEFQHDQDITMKEIQHDQDITSAKPSPVDEDGFKLVVRRNKRR